MEPLNPTAPAPATPQKPDETWQNFDPGSYQPKPHASFPAPGWMPEIGADGSATWQSEEDRVAYRDLVEQHSPHEFAAIKGDDTGDVLRATVKRDHENWAKVGNAVNSGKAEDSESGLNVALRDFDFWSWATDRGLIAKRGEFSASAFTSLVSGLGGGIKAVGSIVGEPRAQADLYMAQNVYGSGEKPQGAAFSTGVAPGDQKYTDATDASNRRISAVAAAGLNTTLESTSELGHVLADFSDKAKRSFGVAAGYLSPAQNEIITKSRDHDALVRQLDAQGEQQDTLKALAKYSGMSETEMADSGLLVDLFINPINRVPVEKAFAAAASPFIKQATKAFAPGLTESLRAPLAAASKKLSEAQGILDTFQTAAKEGADIEVASLHAAEGAARDAQDAYDHIKGLHAASNAADSEALQAAGGRSLARKAAAGAVGVGAAALHGAGTGLKWVDGKIGGLVAGVVGDNAAVQGTVRGLAAAPVGYGVAQATGSNSAGIAAAGLVAGKAASNALLAASNTTGILRDILESGETLLPSSRRFAQQVASTPLPTTIANLLDPNIGGAFVRGSKLVAKSAITNGASVAGNAAKGAVTAGAIGGAFGFVQSGGDLEATVNSAAGTAGLGFVAGGLGTFSSVSRDTQRIKMLESERTHLRTRWGLDTKGPGLGNLSRFDELDHTQQLIAAHYLHTRPDVSLLFTSRPGDMEVARTAGAHQEGVPGYHFIDRDTGQSHIVLDPTQSDASLYATLPHELRHEITKRPDLRENIIRTLMGDADLGMPGLFTLRDDKGQPVASVGADGRRSFTLNQDFAAAKAEYVGRIRKDTKNPGYDISDEDFALEYDAETTAHRWIAGDFEESVSPTLSGQLFSKLEDSKFLRNVLGKMGVSFDRNFNVAGHTSVVGNIKFSPGLKKLTDAYTREWSRGDSSHTVDVEDKSPGIDISKSDNLNDLVAASNDFNRNPDGTLAGTIVREGKTVVVDPRKLLKTAAQAKKDLDAMSQFVEETVRKHAGKYTNDKDVVQIRQQKDGRAVMAGTYFSEEHLADFESSGRFNDVQMENIRNMNELMKLKGGDFVRFFYQRPGNGRGRVDSIRGHWREEMPYAWLVSKQDNIGVRTISAEKFVNNLERLWAEGPAQEIWSNTANMVSDAWDYLGQVSRLEDTADTDKTNFLNLALGLKGKERGDVNPLFSETLNKKLEAFVRLRRIDRVNRTMPGQTTGKIAWSHEAYTRAVANLSPERPLGKVAEAGRPGADATKEAEKPHPLTELLAKWSDGEITADDLAGELETMIDAGKAPENLTSAVNTYRREAREDFEELGGRGDSESYVGGLVDAVKQAIPGEAKEPTQGISSAKTSLKQVPALFKSDKFEPNGTNINIGAGAYDLGDSHLVNERGVKESVPFDPFNRTAEENKAAVDRLVGGERFGTATAPNVLNVIKEAGVRDNVIRQAARSIEPDGKAYFQVYEGDGSGKGRETSAGYQNNLKTAEYMSEVEKHFGEVGRRGNIIIASKPDQSGDKAFWKLSADGESMRFSGSRETPDFSALNILYNKDGEIKAPEGKTTNTQVASVLKQAAREHWGEAIDSRNITPEQKIEIADIATEEVAAHLKQTGHAGNWYTTAIKAAMAVARVLYPEMLNDKSAKKAGFADAKTAELGLAVSMAITSQNLSVPANTKCADEQYSILKAAGRFDPSKKYGAKSPAIQANLKLANRLLDKSGWTGLNKFLAKEFTVADLEKYTKDVLGIEVSIAGKVDDIVNGAAVFGPKIGQGFLQNLLGKFDPVTVDLWMRRTWGRWTGDTAPDKLSGPQIARLIDSARAAGIELPDGVGDIKITEGATASGKNKGKRKVGMDRAELERVLSDPELVGALKEFASEHADRWQKAYSELRVPHTPEEVKKFRDGKINLEQLNESQQGILAERKALWKALTKSEKAAWNAKGDALEKPKPGRTLFNAEIDAKAGRTEVIGAKELSVNKPEWAKSSKVVAEIDKPTDAPSDLDRRVITEIINQVRTNLESRGIKTTNADLQAILWYPEKDIWSALSGKGKSKLKNSYDEEFLKLAESRGLGDEARDAIDQHE